MKEWEIVSIDELEALPADDEGLMWRPVRRRFGIQSFGINAYTASEAGQRVVEEHAELDGHEELYFVATGAARFTLNGDAIQVPAGSFVHARPGVRRGAVAAEAGTTVLAIGAKAGEVFAPSPWEGTFAAFGYRRKGEVERGRRELHEAMEAHPDDWQGPYNAACFEALEGDGDAALAYLEQAVALEQEKTLEWAAKDTDLDALRDDPRFPG